jgi:hypothetical protein
VLKPLSFQQLHGIDGREIHRLFHISVKKSGKLSTVPMTTAIPIRTRVIYNQRFNRIFANTMVRWGPVMCGHLWRMAASSSVSWSTPLAKMLIAIIIHSSGEDRNHGW